MAQPHHNPGYAYPPPQPNAYPPQQPNAYPQQQQPYGSPYGPPQGGQPQVYVHQQKPKSSSEKVGSAIGGTFASMIKSGQDLTKGGGKAASSLGKSIGVAAADLAKGASSTHRGFQDEYNKNKDSPLLRCFQVGSGIQLMSKAGQGCLRCLPNGCIDGKGVLGHDYSCHWLVVRRWDNKLTLRNGAFPQFHLSNALNQTVGTGIGDEASTFRLNETSSHYVTLEHEITHQYVGVDHQQNLVPANQVTSNGLNSLFEVHLVYSPTGHVYKPTH